MNEHETPDDEGSEIVEGEDMVTFGTPRPSRRWPGRAAPIAGVAVIALAGGAGVGYAATHSGAASAAPTVPPSRHPRPRRRRARHLARRLADLTAGSGPDRGLGSRSGLGPGRLAESCTDS